MKPRFDIDAWVAVIASVLLFVAIGVAVIFDDKLPIPADVARLIDCVDGKAPP